MRQPHVKPVQFCGSSLDDLRGFPSTPRRLMGYQIDRVQHGMEPDDYKPMPTVGAGCYEIRVKDPCGAFRAIYVAKFAKAVYVLHCFQKKTPKTAQLDMDIAKRRYREILKEQEK